MSREFGPKTCDACFTVIEGRAGNYCSVACEQDHMRELGIADDDDDMGDRSCMYCGENAVDLNSKKGTCKYCGNDNYLPEQL